MDLFEQSDYRNALIRFELCSQSNYPPSFIMLGYLYGNAGFVGPAQKERELFWLDSAKAYYSFFLDPHSDPKLIFIKALFFNYTQDYKKAFEYFLISANQGCSPAQYHTGYCYQYGLGIQINTIESFKYYSMSAEKGHARSLYYVGYCYQYGVGTQQDDRAAVNYFQIAADKGNQDAQCSLGYCYQKGIGVPLNLSMALNLYKLSAEQGNSTAQFNYGYCLQFGLGTTNPDIPTAAKYYQLSADQGYAPAIFNIAECYEKGTGVTKNLQTAMNYYQLCGNNPNAQARLQLLKKQAANLQNCSIQ